MFPSGAARKERLKSWKSEEETFECAFSWSEALTQNLRMLHSTYCKPSGHMSLISSHFAVVLWCFMGFIGVLDHVFVFLFNRDFSFL